MDFRRELGKMERDRNRRLSVIPHLIYMHDSYDGDPVPIKELDCMIPVLELLDLGYLERDAFPVTRSGGTVTSLYYNGHYPLTMEGEEKYRHFLEGRHSARLRRVIILLVLAVISAAVLFLLGWMQ